MKDLLRAQEEVLWLALAEKVEAPKVLAPILLALAGIKLPVEVGGVVEGA